MPETFKKGKGNFGLNNFSMKSLIGFFYQQKERGWNTNMRPDAKKNFLSQKLKLVFDCRFIESEIRNIKIIVPSQICGLQTRILVLKNSWLISGRVLVCESQTHE